MPDDRWDEHVALRQRLISGERFIGIEVRGRDKTGAPIDLRVSAAPLRGADGRVRGMALFLEDINDRKRAERAIRRLASLPEQSPDPVVEVDLAGNALYVNQAARARFPDLQALGSCTRCSASLARSCHASGMARRSRSPSRSATSIRSTIRWSITWLTRPWCAFSFKT